MLRDMWAVMNFFVTGNNNGLSKTCETMTQTLTKCAPEHSACWCRSAEWPQWVDSYRIINWRGAWRDVSVNGFKQVFQAGKYMSAR